MKEPNILYAWLVDVEDTLRLTSQEKSIRDTEALYNFNAIAKERDEQMADNKRLKWITGGMLLLCVLFTATIYYVARRYRANMGNIVLHKQLLLEEEKKRGSVVPVRWKRTKNR